MDRIQKQTKQSNVTKEGTANNISVIPLTETSKWETEDEEIKIIECRIKEKDRNVRTRGRVTHYI